MSRDDRSLASLGLSLAAAALLGVALALPWFTYDYSSGRQTPVGGFHDANETGIVAHRYDAGPAGGEGDVSPQDVDRADRVLRWMAWSLFAALGLLALAALAEVPRLDRVLVRRAVLGGQAFAFLAVLAALLLAWFAYPPAFGHGVDGPFTSFLAEDGYTRTTLGLGWVLAALALPLAFGGFLAKFQAGGLDPTSDADLLEAVK